MVSKLIDESPRARRRDHVAPAIVDAHGFGGGRARILLPAGQVENLRQVEQDVPVQVYELAVRGDRDALPGELLGFLELSPPGE